MAAAEHLPAMRGKRVTGQGCVARELDRCDGNGSARGVGQVDDRRPLDLRQRQKRSFDGLRMDFQPLGLDHAIGAACQMQAAGGVDVSRVTCRKPRLRRRLADIAGEQHRALDENSSRLALLQDFAIFTPNFDRHTRKRPPDRSVACGIAG